MARSDHNKSRHAPGRNHRINTLRRSERRSVKLLLKSERDEMIELRRPAVSYCGMGCCWL